MQRKLLELKTEMQFPAIPEWGKNRKMACRGTKKFVKEITIEKNSKKVKFKKWAYQKQHIFSQFRTFSKLFFDFLTSRNSFWTKVSNKKVVQNEIPYISLFSKFLYDKNWRKSIFPVLSKEHTKTRNRFLEMPHGEKLQNVFSFYPPITFWRYLSNWQGWLS